MFQARLKFDLQWFAREPFFDADGGAPAGGGETDVTPSEPTPAPAQTGQQPSGGTAAIPPFLRKPLGRPDMVNPILAAAQGGGDQKPPSQQPQAPAAQQGTDGQAETTQPTKVQQEPEILDFGGRKVPVVDPIIKELYNDWQNLNRTYQQANQKALTVEQQNQMLTEMLQTLKSQMVQTAQPQKPQQPEGPTAEELREFNEKVLNTFYDDPLKAQQMLIENPLIKSAIEKTVEQLVEQKVAPVLTPIQKQQKLQAEYQEVVNKYPDFNEYVPAMQQALQMYPNLDGQPLEQLYLFAKGLTVTQQPPAKPPTLEEILADPNAQQVIMGNEQIKNAIINSYLQEVQKNQTGQPPLMAGQPGGMPPQINQNRPKSIQEAGKAFRQALTGGAG